MNYFNELEMEETGTKAIKVEEEPSELICMEEYETKDVELITESIRIA